MCEVSTACIDNHQFNQEELEPVGEVSKVYSELVLEYLYLARIGTPDVLCSVNKLARAVTKWTGKRATQYLPTPKSRWRTLEKC